MALNVSLEVYTRATAGAAAMKRALTEGLDLGVAPILINALVSPGDYDAGDAAKTVEVPGGDPISIPAGTITNTMRLQFAALLAQVGPGPTRKVGAVGQPAFAAGVANLGGYRTAGFFKDVGDMVWLDGSVTITGAAPKLLFTLPDEYAPDAAVQFVCWSFNGAAAVKVTPDGQVTWLAGTGPDLNLNGIAFRRS